MLKTNSKQVKEAIRKYLQEGFENSGCNLDEGIYNGLTLPEMARKFLDIMEKEYPKFYGGNFYSYAAIADYLQGLPSSISVRFYYNEERNLLKEWLQETDEESNRFEDDKMNRLYWFLISREIIKLSKMK